jgi:hypothetical protein
MDPIMQAERTLRRARRMVSERPPGGIEVVDIEEIGPTRRKMTDLESSDIGRPTKDDPPLGDPPLRAVRA